MKMSLISLVFLFLFSLAAVGYIKNIVHFIGCDFEQPYKAEVVYGVGIFAPPVGAITGWINIEDNK